MIGWPLNSALTTYIILYHHQQNNDKTSIQRMTNDQPSRRLWCNSNSYSTTFFTVHTTFSSVHLQCNFGEALCLLLSFFFVLNNSYSTKRHSSYSFFFFFLVFRLYFFFFYIYCYINTTNFTIFSQLLRCQFFISQNKIIKYETVTNHNWK